MVWMCGSRTARNKQKGEKYRYSDVFPLDPRGAVIQGHHFAAPKNVTSFLAQRYGDWMQSDPARALGAA